jgi:elongation factor Ts
MNPKDVAALLAEEYIRDTSMKIADLVKQTIAKLGENISVARFARIVLGDPND